VAVTERGNAAPDVHDSYYRVLKHLIPDLEFIYILTPQYHYLEESLLQRQLEGQSITLIHLSRDFGEATALQIGIKESRHDLILTLPPYEQITAESIPGIFSKLGSADLVDVCRFPRKDGLFSRLRKRIFTKLIHLTTGTAASDPGCGVRLARRQLFDGLQLYGDLHRFLSVLAIHDGYQVETLVCPQSEAESHRRKFSTSTYIARLLDIMAVTFLTRFRQKPLRFFGTLGSFFLAIGSAGLLFVAFERFVFDIPAASRPLLLGFSIFFTLGVQLIAIGLVGETIVFANADSISSYRVKRIVDYNNTGKNKITSVAKPGNNMN
jgi:hypothetical protein